MPLLLAMENHTIDPIIIIKANNRLVRQSDSVSSKWLSCSFCLNGIQFSSVQYVFIYVASAAIKILSFWLSQPAAVARKTFPFKGPWRESSTQGKTNSPLQSISHEANTAVKHYRCKWAVLLRLSGSGFQQELQTLNMPPRRTQEHWLAYFT